MELKLVLIVIVPNLFLMTESRETSGNKLKSITLMKCCPFGQYFDKDLYGNDTYTGIPCRNTKKNFDPQVFDGHNLLDQTAMELFNFKISVTPCNASDSILWYAADVYSEYYLEQNGKLLIQDESEMSVDPEHYCIDYFAEDSEEPSLNALLCLKEVTNRLVVPKRFSVTASCMLVSCVFIFLTLGVYLYLPRFNKLHDKIFAVYLGCLFVAFLLQAILQLLQYYETHTVESCLGLTFAFYFSSQSTFCWLNVMCYKMWKSFIWNLNSCRSRTMNSSLRIYAMYAFGLPTLLTVLLISLEFSELPKNRWLPPVQSDECFLTDVRMLLYLYGPISIFCTINILFFIQLTYCIIKAKLHSTSELKSTESMRHGKNEDQKALSLCVKIFILMGINWILEVVSAYYQNLDWIYSDIFNVLIGFIIFVTFICKKNIYYDLKKRYSQRKNSAYLGTSRTTTSYI